MPVMLPETVLVLGPTPVTVPASLIAFATVQQTMSLGCRHLAGIPRIGYKTECFDRWAVVFVRCNLR